MWRTCGSTPRAWPSCVGATAIARLEIFGSVAREQRPDSDVDLLYTLGGALDWEVEDLVESLTEVFHRPVGPVSRRSLHPMIRDRVMAEAETLYAAA